jgi:hypothetical protein
MIEIATDEPDSKDGSVAARFVLIATILSVTVTPELKRADHGECAEGQQHAAQARRSNHTSGDR